MAMAVEAFLLVLSALFPIVDPLSGSPIFLALTSEYSPAMRRVLALRVAVDSFFLLVGSYFVGSHVLAFFGVSLPVVQVGGGLIVIAIGWTMLMQKDRRAGQHSKSSSAPRHIPPGLLSPDDAPDRGPGIRFRRNHLGRELSPPLWLPALDHPGCPDGHRLRRAQCISVRWICGPVGPSAGRHYHDGDCSPLLISLGLHWGADCVERTQRPAFLRDFSSSLI